MTSALALPASADPHHAAPAAAAADPALRAARAFLRPANARRGASLGFLGATRHVASPAGRIAVAEAGAGRTVLLIHGWEGQAADLAAFAAPLIAAGHRVVALDLPAHGESAGDTVSIPLAAQALQAVQAEVGPLHAAIGHSVGSAVLVEAMAHGLNVGRVAVLAAPARYADYARGFAAQAGLDAAQTARMLQALKQQGVDVAAVAIPLAAARLHQPALFVHSADDRTVPIVDAQASVAAWAGARLLRVDGLGHRRLLQAPEVVAAVCGFVMADEGSL